MADPRSNGDVLPALRVLYFASFAGMGLYLPYFPTWLEQYGVAGFRMSLIMALLPILSVLSPSLFGAFADAVGVRGSLLRVAALGTFAAFSTLTVILWSSAAPFFIAAFGSVLAYAFFKTPLHLMADVIALEHSRDYGSLRLWGSLGFLVAATAGGHFLPLKPVWLLPACIAVVSLMPVLASGRLPKRSALPPAPIGPEFRRLLARPGYTTFLLCALLAQGSHVVCELCLTLRLGDLGASGDTIGLAWAISTAAEVGLMAYGRKLPLAGAGTHLLTFTLLISALRWTLIGSLTDIGLLLFIQPLHALTFALRWLISLELVRRFATPQSLATSQGLFVTASSVGSALGMLGWGTAYRTVSGPFVFFAAAAVALVGALVAVALGRKLRREEAQARPCEELAQELATNAKA